jgi:hypothetical protein
MKKFPSKTVFVLGLLFLMGILACGGASTQSDEGFASSSGGQLTPILPSDPILSGDGGDDGQLLGLTFRVWVPTCGMAFDICGDFCPQDEMREFYEDFLDGNLADPASAFPQCRLYYCRNRAAEFRSYWIPWDKTTMDCNFYDSEPGSRCQLDIEDVDADVPCTADDSFNK